MGVVATQLLRRIAEAQRFEVNARDPATLAVAAITVALAALVAAYLPARHASRVDPIVVRAEVERSQRAKFRRASSSSGWPGSARFQRSAKRSYSRRAPEASPLCSSRRASAST